MPQNAFPTTFHQNICLHILEILRRFFKSISLIWFCRNGRYMLAMENFVQYNIFTMFERNSIQVLGLHHDPISVVKKILNYFFPLWQIQWFLEQRFWIIFFFSHLYWKVPGTKILNIILLSSFLEVLKHDWRNKWELGR